MSRSLFESVGPDRRRKAEEYYERVRTSLPLDVLLGDVREGAFPGSVAVIGGGFAGCSAARVATNLGFAVTLFDPFDTVGGRVRSTVLNGRVVELGAELIGTNHPAWLALAHKAALQLDKVDDGGLLPYPLLLRGRLCTKSEHDKLEGEMRVVYDGWIKQSMPTQNPRIPWGWPGADGLDRQSLADHIPTGDPLLKYAIETDFMLNNTVPAQKQSWLAVLAQINAGGGWGFFDDTEVYRCHGGNAQLAKWLVQGVKFRPQTVVRQILINAGSPPAVTLRGTNLGPAESFDRVIVATPAAVWHQITVKVDGQPRAFYKPIQSGDAIKYQAPVKGNFWGALGPDGLSDVMGMTWEGGASPGGGNTDFTVFAGGHAARKAIASHGTDDFYNCLIQQLYTKYSPGWRAGPGTFVNWPEMPMPPALQLKAIGTGYSCPAPGEVTTVQKSYSQPLNPPIPQLFIAGEHTSPAWFGFMEGALESGLCAAVAMAAQAGVDLPAGVAAERPVPLG